MFEVIEFDGRSRTMQIQDVDGNIDEIAEADWIVLPLLLEEPPLKPAAAGPDRFDPMQTLVFLRGRASRRCN